MKLWGRNMLSMLLFKENLPTILQLIEFAEIKHQFDKG